MAKQLTQWELETIIVSLETYRNKVTTEHGLNLPAVIDGIDELGKYFTEKAEKKSDGWGLSIDTRWA